MTSYPRLTGDIGGTNARFAWLEAAGQPLVAKASYPCAQFGSLQQAIEHYLSEQRHPVPAWAAMGMANPVSGDQVKMTNRDWAFSIAGMKRALGLQRLLVINDFTA